MEIVGGGAAVVVVSLLGTAATMYIAPCTGYRASSLLNVQLSISICIKFGNKFLQN